MCQQRVLVVTVQVRAQPTLQQQMSLNQSPCHTHMMTRPAKSSNTGLVHDIVDNTSHTYFVPKNRISLFRWVCMGIAETGLPGCGRRLVASSNETTPTTPTHMFSVCA